MTTRSKSTSAQEQPQALELVHKRTQYLQLNKRRRESTSDDEQEEVDEISSISDDSTQEINADEFDNFQDAPDAQEDQPAPDAPDAQEDQESQPDMDSDDELPQVLSDRAILVMREAHLKDEIRFWKSREQYILQALRGPSAREDLARIGLFY